MKYEVFEALMEAKGVKPIDVAKATGIRTSTLTDWKKGRYTPKKDKMKKIADYFGVTVEETENEDFASQVPIYELSAGQGRVNGSYATEYMDEEQDSEMDYSWCTICGDSMYPELKDGDKVKVLHQTETTPQDLTVVKIDGESCTVKYVEITDTGVWLRAINKAVFEDRFYTIREVMQLPVKIIGKVVEVRREY